MFEREGDSLEISVYEIADWENRIELENCADWESEKVVEIVLEKLTVDVNDCVKVLINEFEVVPDSIAL